MTDPVADLLRLAGARPAPPPERTQRVRAAVHAEWQRTVARRRRRAIGAVGGLALAAGLIVALGVQLPPSSPAPAMTVATVERVSGARASLSLVPGAAVTTGVGLESGSGRVALRLRSGTSVRLDVETRLSFRSAAVVELQQGALYVDSPPGAAPLEVRTPRGVARELGTQFEVRVLEPEVRVRVREGAVRLEGPARSEEAAGGDELRTSGLDITRRAIPVHGEPWAWVLDIAPAFPLEGRTLDDFLAWVCRENGWALELANEPAQVARATVLHGSVEGLTPTQALEAVLPTSGFVARVEGRRLIVARAAR